jgi:SNF2 family DNA or RNA helicase
VLHLLFPEEYPTKTQYVERFLNVEWNIWGGRDITGLNPLHGEEFMDNFRTRSRRLTKEVVLPFLPKKVYETRWVTLPTKLRKAYADMEKTLVAELEDSTMVAENALVRAGRLTQLANAYGEMTDDGRFLMSFPSPKVEAFMEDVTEGDFLGQQVVVFSDSKELLSLLEHEMSKKKVEHVIITGDVTGDDRQHAIDTFQEGKAQFCLLTRAGGEGITLTAASTMVRLMRSWSHTVHTQVEDRTHRIGSEIHDVVTYIDYITDDTIEMGQMVRLNAKEARAQEVLRDADLLALIKGRA